MKILVLGGAGFIGSHLVDELIEKDYQVTILDNLIGNGGKIPDYLNLKAKFIQGDIRDKKLLKKIIPDFSIIFHTASIVGISQSNYLIKDFVDNNLVGTATLLEAIIESKNKPKLIISSSNTSYGEGVYNCKTCGEFHPPIRTLKYIKKYGLDLVCPKCKKPSDPFPTLEETSLDCNSVYALTKKNQEELSILLGKLYNFPVVSLRYFNVFGPRQSLSNPYTGVSAIFMNRVKNNNPPVIYEDGLQTRDFVFISDIVKANILAMENPKANYEIFNVGSKNPITIKHIAEEICKFYNKDFEIEITGKFRMGDIRHCIADISKIKNKLGWEPTISFEKGLKKVYEWSKKQKSEDDFEKADKELKERGLV